MRLYLLSPIIRDSILCTYSLTATIKAARPDLLPDRIVGQEQAIPPAMPPQFAEKQVHHVEGIGQPTSACFFTLSRVDPTQWLMFEKYDGVRGFWNPQTKALYSRRGKQIHIPQHITDEMPLDMFLDGELWYVQVAVVYIVKVIAGLEEGGFKRH